MKHQLTQSSWQPSSPCTDWKNWICVS